MNAGAQAVSEQGVGDVGLEDRRDPGSEERGG